MWFCFLWKNLLACKWFRSMETIWFFCLFVCLYLIGGLGYGGLWSTTHCCLFPFYRFIHSRPVDGRSLTLAVKSGVLAASQPAVICNTVNVIRPDQSFLLLVFLTDLHPLPLPPTPTSPYIQLLQHTCTRTRRPSSHNCPNPPSMSSIHWWLKAVLGCQCI